MASLAVALQRQELAVEAGQLSQARPPPFPEYPSVVRLGVSRSR
jgi:hypothetical protein